MEWPPLTVPPTVNELTRKQVKPHKVENAWKPGSIKHSKKEEEAITIDIVKKTREIVNKLTPANFVKLSTEFVNLPFEDREERISKVVKIIFEKALIEPPYSKEYAKMVRTICGASKETSKKFRKQILDQFQQEFQNDRTDEAKIKHVEIQLEKAAEDKKDQLKAELEELKFQNRRRALNNMRFIGELFKLQMLTPQLIVEYIAVFLSSTDEKSLECLIKLLIIVGRKLEQQLDEVSARIKMIKGLKGKQQDDPVMKMPEFNPGENWMAKTMDSLRNLSENQNLPSTIRVALRFVVELRDNSWIPKRDAADAPKPIDQKGAPEGQVQQQQHPKFKQQQQATSAPQGQGLPQQQLFIPPAGYQYIQSPQGPTYVLNPQGFQQTRYMAPGHPTNFQILYTAPPQQHQMYQAAAAQQQQNHPTMIQHHQAAAAAQQQAAQNYYYQQHLAQQNRLPVHTPAVQVQVSSVQQTHKKSQHSAQS